MSGSEAIVAVDDDAMVSAETRDEAGGFWPSRPRLPRSFVEAVDTGETSEGTSGADEDVGAGAGAIKVVAVVSSAIGIGVVMIEEFAPESSGDVSFDEAIIRGLDRGECRGEALLLSGFVEA